MALARALVTEPRILLRDEPWSALDASLKVRMQALMSKLQRDLGITFVYVTHSHAEAFSMADRVVIMSRGKIEQIGTPVEVYRKPATRFVAEFVGASNILDGTVTAANGTSLGVATKLGSFTLAKPASGAAAPVGSTISFVLPEDEVRPATANDSPSLNRLKGRVVGEEFLGAHVRLYLELADGHELRVLVGHGRDIPRSDTEMSCVWAPEAAFVLPVGSQT